MIIIHNNLHVQYWFRIYVCVRFVYRMIMIVDLCLKSFHRIGTDSKISPNSLNDLFFSTHLLQADSHIECDQWINSLQLTITNLFKSPDKEISNSSSVSSFEKEYLDCILFFLVIIEFGYR